MNDLIIQRTPARRVLRRIGYYALAVVFFLPMLLARRITRVPEAIDFSDNDAEFMARHEGDFERAEITEPRFGHSLQITFFPAETHETARPCVLIAHGLGGKVEQMYPQAIALHEEGCDVCLFDFRGHGASGGVFGSLGYLETFDIIAVTQWLRREKNIARIVLYGFSMGAVAATLAAAYGPGVDGLIAESPFDSMQNIVMHNARKFHTPVFLVKLVLWGTDVRRGIEYKMVDLVRAMPRLKGLPFLLAGTTGDATVPVEQTRRVAQYLGEGQVYWEADGPGHGAILHSEHGPEFLDQIRALLNRCK